MNPYRLLFFFLLITPTVLWAQLAKDEKAVLKQLEQRQKDYAQVAKKSGIWRNWATWSTKAAAY